MLEAGSSYRGYKIVQFLGAGGSGSVYRAIQEGLEREVALKIVKVAEGAGSEERKRFLREARALARISHEHIVRIYDFGEEETQLYYSMEYAPGRSLDHLIRSEESLPPDRALPILDQLLGALETVHALGVFHRDIKPANILMRPSGAILLSDFGLARERGATRMTREGVMLGTLPYFPPEMCKATETDARADLYQAAVMLHEMLMGSTPYGNEQMFMMLKGEALDPGPPSQRVSQRFGPGLGAFVRRGLSPDPARRFQNAREMRDALDPLRAPPPSVSRPVPRRPDRRTPAGAHDIILPEDAIDASPGVPGNSPTRTAPHLQLAPGSIPAGVRRRVLVAASIVCWLGALVMAWRLTRSETPPEVRPPIQPPPGVVKPRPPAPAVSTARSTAARTFKTRLLLERELPMTATLDARVGGFSAEAVIVAAKEIAGVAIRWEPADPAPRLEEVNGVRVAAPGRLLPAQLVDGNNRLGFRMEKPPLQKPRGLLLIRRRAGASLDFGLPSLPPAVATSTEAEVTRMLDRAKIDFQAGRYNDALRGCETASQRDPRSWQASWKKGVAMHYLAYVAQGLRAAGGGLEILAPDEQDPDRTRLEMLACFNRAFAIHPAEGNIWYDLGNAYRDFMRYADAERAYAMGCVLDGSKQRFWWELCRTVAYRIPKGQERGSSAMKLALEASVAMTEGETAPTPTYLAGRGALYQRAGRLDDARRDFRQVLAIEPSNKLARTGLEQVGGR